jgi:hypothetical protein
MVDISCLTDNIPSGNFLHSYGIDGPFSANCDLPSYKTVIFRSANSTSWPEGNLQKSHLGSSWIGKCEIATRDLAHASTHFAPFWRMTIHDSPIRDHHKKSNVMFKDTVSPKKIEHLRLQNVHLFRISHAFLKHFGKKKHTLSIHSLAWMRLFLDSGRTLEASMLSLKRKLRASEHVVMSCYVFTCVYIIALSCYFMCIEI